MSFTMDGREHLVLQAKWKDKASDKHLSWPDRIRTAWKLGRSSQITYGKNCIIKSNVDIKLTDNAKLELGNNVVIDSYAFILLTKPRPHLIIGDHVSIGRFNVLAIKGTTKIGAYTMFAAYCSIHDQAHSYDKSDLILNQQSVIEDVTIGSDCWFGAGVRILKGVTIGDGAVVATGSVVNSDIPAYEVWGGVPAKFIKKRT